MTLTTRVAAGTVTIDRRATDFGPVVLQAELTLDRPIHHGRGHPTIRFIYRAAPNSAHGLYRLLRALGTPTDLPRKNGT